MIGKCQTNVSGLALTLSDGKIGFCYTVALESCLLLTLKKWQARDFGNILFYCQKLGSYLSEISGKRPLSPTGKQTWKMKAARLTKYPLFGRLLGLVVRLTVPRQRVGVALVALNEANEVFLLRHVFHPYYEWGLPGGWLKKDEAPAAGVLRELREETGLTAVLGLPVSVLHNLIPPHIGIAYVGKLNPGDITLSHEIMETNWFPADNLPGPLSPHTRQAIKAAVVARQVAELQEAASGISNEFG